MMEIIELSGSKICDGNYIIITKENYTNTAGVGYLNESLST